MLEKLVEIQRREGLTDGQMAARLNISRSSWNLARNGRSAFRDEWAVRAAGQWPELTRDLLDLALGSTVSGNGEADPVEVAS